MDIRNEIESTQRNEAIEARERFEANIGNVWGHSSLGLEAKKAAMAMLSTKTGLYAKVPITCKADTCPYSNTCALLPYGLAPFGEKCPWETALIESRYAGYMADYDLDSASFTDSTIVSELINIDVMLERTKALISEEQTPITEVVAGMTESGEQFTRPEVSKAYEIYERNLNRKERLLESLLGTRKSRKGQQEQDSSIQDILASALETTEFIIEEKPDNIE
ncbi:MAG: hypothetical protein J6D47_05285 [Peptostreptococcaceae bacterium]|jgi:hypothetical protein|nr:hypothetical protein [Peptostreptococcaceae bacterium]